MKRSPNTRVSSPTILNLNAFSYHSAVLRGSDAFKWMWLIRNAMARASRWAPQGVCARGSGQRARCRTVRGESAGCQRRPYICGLGPATRIRIRPMVTARPSARVLRRLLALALALSSVAGTTGGGPALAQAPPPARPGANTRASGPGTVESFMVVDCLLPGQIRQLGGKVTYVTARRAVKTAARDCEI